MADRRELDTSLENQFTPAIDDAGNVVGGSMTRHDADFLASMRLLREAAERFPLDEADIVIPPGAMLLTEVRDADGSVVARIRTIQPDSDQ